MTNLLNDLMTGLDEVESFLEGNKADFRVHVPAEVNVKKIRYRLRMTQAKFSDAFGFSLDAVKHWEGGRRTPEASARAYLTVIAKNPTAVIAALANPSKGKTTAKRATATKRGSGSRKRASLLTARAGV
jgi:putative transcriptional regulator